MRVGFYGLGAQISCVNCCFCYFLLALMFLPVRRVVFFALLLFCVNVKFKFMAAAAVVAEFQC